jgi:signal transduction histidine kinase
MIARTAKGESPARRLGILYIASLCAIAALSAWGQACVLEELNWQGRVLRAITQPARRFTPGKNPDLAAREVQAEANARIERVRRLQVIVFGFVMVVLLLEGLFVICPAIRNIQTFMANLSRAHEELKARAARLERSNKDLQDFASVASHDLQEPLRKILAFSDRLELRCAGALDDQGRDYIARVQGAARRMQTLINDLLTFSRVTTQAQPFAPVDLAAATREVVSDLEVRIEQAKGRVELGALPTIDADPIQVRQLMQNLIGNALKYHRPEEPPVVKVSGRILGTGAGPAAPRCQILVEDNGIGFEEVYAERIFGIFQRLHSRSEYEGTGVGLAVCRKIAERHGGTISARSTPGMGSTFQVTLPSRHGVTEASPANGADSGRAKDDGHPEGRKGQVLCA